MLDFLHQHTPSNFSDAIAIAVYLGKTRGVTEDDLEQQAWDKMRVFKSPRCWCQLFGRGGGAKYRNLIARG